MSRFLSFLLVACVCVSQVFATSESHDHHLIIANHLTAATHSFRTMQTSAAESSYWFGPINGVSTACKATSASLESNSTILAAKNAVIASGCTDAKQAICDPITRICRCVAYYSNDANLRSLVSQSGGRVCSMDIQGTMTFNNGVKVNIIYGGILGLVLVGNSCNNNDLETTLSAYLDAFTQGLGEGSAKSTSNTKITSMTGTISMCGTTYTGTRQINGADNNNKPVAIAIALLIGSIITIINQAL